MGDDRLPTQLWLDAHLKTLTDQGVFFYIHNRGNSYSGTVLLKLNGLENGCLILQQQRDLDGVMGWMSLFDGKPIDEKEADNYLNRCKDRDPDLWILEIEDRSLSNPFEGPVF